MANNFYYSGVDELFLIKRAGTPEDPFMPIKQELTVKYGKVRLIEIPSFQQGVSVENEDMLVEATTAELSENEYRVNYSTGDVFFNPSQEGKTFSFNFLGIGRVVVPASMIPVKTSDGTELNLQDILDTQGEIGVQIGNALTETENIKSLVTNNQVVTNVDFGSYKESTSTQITEQAEDIKSRGIKVEQFIPNITETEDKWDWRAAILNAVNYAHVNKITKVIFPAKDIIIRQQLEISNLEQTTIEMSKSKITFSSNSSSNQGALSAIIFRNLSDCVVTEAYLDIEVNEQQYNGIQVINSKRTRFIKPKVLNATWVGFSIYDNGEITSEDIVLDDPVLEYCRYGLLEHGLRTVVNRGFISNHWSESLEAKVQGEKPIWTEESKFWDGVIVRGRDWEFNKTVIKDNGQSGIYSGQTVGGSLNGVIIEGNWNKGVDFGATKTDVSSIREVTIDGSCVIRNNRTGDVHLYNTDYVTILPGAIIERTDNTYDDYDKYSQACIILNSDSAHNNISEVIVNQNHPTAAAIFVNDTNTPSKNNIFRNNRINAAVKYKVNANRNVIIDSLDGQFNFKSSVAFEQAVKSVLKQSLQENTGYLGREFLNILVSDDNSFGQLTANKPLRVLKSDGSRQGMTVGELIIDSLTASGKLFIHPNGTLILPQTPSELNGGVWFENGEMKYYAGAGVVKTIATK